MRAVALGAGAVAGGAVAAVGTAAFEVSRQTEQASRQIEATLGVSRAQAEELGAVARRVFGNNFAGSVQEAGDAVALLSQQVEGIAGQEQALTEKAFSIYDAFGEPVDRVISAVATLTSEFEDLDPTEAFDLVAAGFQRGLDESGDFLDSIGEYSNTVQRRRIYRGRVLFDDGERAERRHAGHGQDRRRCQRDAGPGE